MSPCCYHCQGKRLCESWHLLAKYNIKCQETFGHVLEFQRDLAQMVKAKEGLDCSILYMLMVLVNLFPLKENRML